MLPDSGSLQKSHTQYAMWFVLCASLLWMAIAVVRSLQFFHDCMLDVQRTFHGFVVHLPFDVVSFGTAIVSHVAAAMAVVVMLAVAYGAGTACVFLFSRSVTGLGLLGLRLAFGMGVVSLLDQGVGLSGILFRELLVPQVIVFAAVGVISAVKHRIWRELRSLLLPSGALAILIGIMLVLLLAMTQLPDTHDDPMAYHFAAPEQYLALHKIHAEPSQMAWHMPLGCEMVLMPAWLLGGITTAKLVNIVYLLCSICVLFALGRVAGVERRLAQWSVFLLVSLGILADSCWQGKNDIALSTYILSAVFCGTCIALGRRSLVLPLAWFAGLAVGVKYTAAIFILAMCGAFLVSGPRWQRFRPKAVVLLLALVPVIGWFASNFLFVGNPLHPFASGIFHDVGWHPEYQSAWRTAFRILSPANSSGPLDIFTAPLRVYGNPMAASFVVYWLLPLGLIFVRNRAFSFLKSFVLIAYCCWVLIERDGRFLFPSFPVVVLIVSAFEGSAPRVFSTFMDWARVPMGVCLSIVALANGARYLAPSGVAYLSGQMASVQYLRERYSTWDEVREWVNRNVPRNGRVLFTSEAHRLWFRPRVLNSPNIGEPLLWKLCHEGNNIQEIRKRAKQLGLTHHLHNFITAEYVGTLRSPGREWVPTQLARYADFIGSSYRTVYQTGRSDYANGGFVVFEILKRTVAKKRLALYLPQTEGMFWRSWARLRRGDALGAFSVAKEASRGMENVAHARSKLGVFAAEAGKNREALGFLLRGAQMGYVDDGNLFYLGAVARKLGRLDLSVWAYCTAYKRMRASETLRFLGEVYFRRAKRNMRIGDHSRAFRDVEQAIVCDPNLSDAYACAVSVLLEMGRHEEAGRFRLNDGTTQ